MAKKQIRHLREGQTEFQKVFSRLCETRSAWQVWSDFVEMVAISISNAVEIREKVKQEREARYMTIIRTYTKKEQAVFPELVGILVQALQRNPEQDFLGEMFMAMELGNHWKGQFFTPYSLCKAMAAGTVSNAGEKLMVKDWIGIHDPACGAGATLIGARNHLELAGIGGTKAFFVGQDIDRTAAMMCYIQLSLLGCAGYVVVGDTLNHPVQGPLLWPTPTEYQDIWFLPLTFLEPAWVLRLSRTWRGLDTEAEADCDEPVTAASPEDEICDEPVTEEPPALMVPVPGEKGTLKVIEDPPSPVEPEPAPEPEQNVSFMDTESGQLTLF